MEGAGVEGYRPEDWGQEETRQLDELVNQLGETKTTTVIPVSGIEATPSSTTFVCVSRSLALMFTGCFFEV